MDGQISAEDYGAEVEVIRGMEPFVKERLSYLIEDREQKWWPSDFLNFMEKDKV